MVPGGSPVTRGATAGSRSPRSQLRFDSEVESVGSAVEVTDSTVVAPVETLTLPPEDAHFEDAIADAGPQSLPGASPETHEMRYMR